MPLLTTKQAAHELGITPGYVRDLIRAKKLRARRLGKRGYYRIEPSEIARYMGVVPDNTQRDRNRARMERAIARCQAQGVF